MNISISESGIAFSAMPTNYLDISNQNNTITNTNKIEDKTYSYKTNQDIGTLVEFRDPTNGKSVVTSLNDKVLDKLKNHFSSKDFENSEENSIKLSGEAEKFVSGWFGDIAYKREFLSADKNQDGNLDSDEYLNTKNEYKHIGYVEFKNNTLFVSGNIEENYKTVKDVNTHQSDRYNHNYIQPNSLDDELNTTLRIDKNFDSKIDIVESFRGDKSKDKLDNKQVVLKNIDEDLDFHSESVRKYFKPILKEALSQSGIKTDSSDALEDELKKQQALMKLLQANGDASKLTAEERAVLGSELQKYEKSTDELSTSLSKALDKKIEVDIMKLKDDYLRILIYNIKKEFFCLKKMF